MDVGDVVHGCRVSGQAHDLFLDLILPLFAEVLLLYEDVDFLTTVIGGDSATCEGVCPVRRILVVLIHIMCGDLLSRTEDDTLLDPSDDVKFIFIIDVTSVPGTEPFSIECGCCSFRIPEVSVHDDVGLDLDLSDTFAIDVPDPDLDEIDGIRVSGVSVLVLVRCPDGTDGDTGLCGCIVVRPLKTHVNEESGGGVLTGGCTGDDALDVVTKELGIDLLEYPLPNRPSGLLPHESGEVEQGSDCPVHDPSLLTDGLEGLLFHDIVYSGNGEEVCGLVLLQSFKITERCDLLEELEFGTAEERTCNGHESCDVVDGKYVEERRGSDRSVRKVADLTIDLQSTDDGVVAELGTLHLSGGSG